MNEDRNKPDSIPEAFIAASAPDLGLDPEECLAPERPAPCAIIIFGASGDLTARKLIPALFDLYVNNGLPDPFVIVGCGRTFLDDSQFRDRLKAALQAGGKLESTQWAGFASALHYQAIGYEDAQSYQNPAERLCNLDDQYHPQGNRVFYLAKETVQNILMFRFANSIFEPIWKRRYVDYVSITATEMLGVEHRAGYYEQAGVIRDMFQNHIMQLLALTAMEPPSRFEANMDFRYDQNYSGPVLDAYEKVLLDCMLGDQMLFWRQDGVERSWAFLTPILNACETCKDRADLLKFYEAGSKGPKAVETLFNSHANSEVC
jgi:glucose-6-phosphate 1-dehydrogenase